MLRKLVLALAVVMSPTLATAQQVTQPSLDRPFRAFDPENDTGQMMSCATAFADGNLNESVKWWVLGVWTGLNAATGSNTGANTDSNGMIGELKLRCSQYPSHLLMGETLYVWQRILHH